MNYEFDTEKVELQLLRKENERTGFAQRNQLSINTTENMCTDVIFIVSNIRYYKSTQTPNDLQPQFANINPLFA